MIGENQVDWNESGIASRQTPSKQGLEYYAPTTQDEAERMKNQAPGYYYFAGGTIINWKGDPRGKGLIDLKHLGLDVIDLSPDQTVIGAMTTIQTIAAHRKLPNALTGSAKLFSSRNIRNMATLGGTVAGQFFVSDVLPILIGFKAEAEYFQNGSKRTMPLVQWLSEKPGLLCAVVLRHRQRTVIFRQDKIAQTDFPLIVTAIGYEWNGAKLAKPVIAVSGASGKLKVSESGAAYLARQLPSALDFRELYSLVQADIPSVGNVKATARVKRGIIESHLKSLIAELQKEGRS